MFDKNISTRFKFFISGYLLLLILLFLYSFTQIDLGLTFSKASIWQGAQKFFQYIGYFDRPLSTVFYITLLSLITIFYCTFLFLVHKKKILERFLWKIIIATAVILCFSYNAFSHDIFNYIFDAKIITYYHQNPYISMAKDFPADPMLGFMHWTHRTYPYGPVWIALTSILSYAGMNIFLVTFFLFKLFLTLFYLGTVYFLAKIMQKIAPAYKTFAMAFFALHPLVLIESLVTGHMEIAMMFCAVWAFYLLLTKKYILAFLLLFLSIGIKFATIFLLPVFLFVIIAQRKKMTIDFDRIFFFSTLLMIIPIVLSSLRTEFQPWYVLWMLPFVSLAYKKFSLVFATIFVSIAPLYTYAFFLFSGNWDPPIPQLKTAVLYSSLLVSIVSFLSLFLNQHKGEKART